MELGLIAMSGVRCCDSDLLEMGLTLPGFVERSTTIASLPSLGLLTLAGMTSSDHTINYWEIDDLPPESELSANLDLVAISSFSARIQDAYTLADQFRQNGTPVVLGGLHVTALPEEAAKHADSVMIGEGEAVWNEILDDTAAGTLKPRYSSFCLLYTSDAADE